MDILINKILSDFYQKGLNNILVKNKSIQHILVTQNFVFVHDILVFAPKIKNIDEFKINNILKKNCLFKLKKYWCLDSTNNYLLNRAEKDHQVVLAHMQLAGRGQRENTWLSPLGNLYLSLSFSFANIKCLSLVVGLSIAQTIEKLFCLKIQLKWPNDLYYKNKKLGGILIENKFCKQKHYAVIGIGLNIETTKIKIPAIGLIDVILTTFNQEDFITKLIVDLSINFIKFNQYGFCAFYKDWFYYDVFRGNKALVTQERKKFIGTYQGIDENGLLRLQLKNQEKKFLNARLSFL